MVDICPTVTADNPHVFRQQMERVTAFTKRVHIDLSDGTLAPNKLMSLDQVWWPATVRADLHMMMLQPVDHIEIYKTLNPQLVIIHAEGRGHFNVFAEMLHAHGIETGVALLPETPIEMIVPDLHMIDHVMIFSGKLGSFGGEVDLNLLDKVRALKTLKPQLEIGWDGGVNERNAYQLVEAGVEVLNVGGAIQRAEDPTKAYEDLVFATMPKA